MFFIPFASRGVEERSIDCVLYQSIYCWHKGQHICLLLLHKWYRALNWFCFPFKLLYCWHKHWHICLLLSHKWYRSSNRFCFSFKLLNCWHQGWHICLLLLHKWYRAFHRLCSSPIDLLLAQGSTYLSSNVAQVVSSATTIVWTTNHFTAGTRVDIFVLY